MLQSLGEQSNLCIYHCGWPNAALLCLGAKNTYLSYITTNGMTSWCPLSCFGWQCISSIWITKDRVNDFSTPYSKRAQLQSKRLKLKSIVCCHMQQCLVWCIFVTNKQQERHTSSNQGSDLVVDKNLLRVIRSWPAAKYWANLALVTLPKEWIWFTDTVCLTPQCSFRKAITVKMWELKWW